MCALDWSTSMATLSAWHPLASRGHHSAQSKLYVCLGYTGTPRTKLYSESRTYSAAYSYHMHGNNVHGCVSCFNLPTSPLYICFVRSVLELLPNLHDVKISRALTKLISQGVGIEFRVRREPRCIRARSGSRDECSRILACDHQAALA